MTFSLLVDYKVLTNSQLIRAECKTCKRWWERALLGVKCGLSVIGEASLGAIAGATVGTVTVLIIGTVSGAALGFWGGLVLL